MKKFRIWDNKIEEIEIIKETAQYVTETDGRRWAKRNPDFRNYFDSWEEAHQFLMDREGKAIRDLERRIHVHEKNLEEIEAMNACGK